MALKYRLFLIIGLLANVSCKLVLNGKYIFPDVDASFRPKKERYSLERENVYISPVLDTSGFYYLSKSLNASDSYFNRELNRYSSNNLVFKFYGNGSLSIFQKADSIQIFNASILTQDSFLYSRYTCFDDDLICEELFFPNQSKYYGGYTKSYYFIRDSGNTLVGISYNQVDWYLNSASRQTEVEIPEVKSIVGTYELRRTLHSQSAPMKFNNLHKVILEFYSDQTFEVKTVYQNSNRQGIINGIYQLRPDNLFIDIKEIISRKRSAIDFTTHEKLIVLEGGKIIFIVNDGGKSILEFRRNSE
jgi:hypothetical protein